MAYKCHCSLARKWFLRLSGVLPVSLVTPGSYATNDVNICFDMAMHRNKTTGEVLAMVFFMVFLR